MSTLREREKYAFRLFNVQSDEGPSICRQFMEDIYRECWDEIRTSYEIDRYIKRFFFEQINIKLLPVGKLGEKTVTFIPGHVIGSPGSGPVHADVMVVGKAPGIYEHRKGRFWCGQAAEYLHKLFYKNDLDFNSCYGTNLVKFYPPVKSIPKAWVKECLYFLEQEFRLVKPKFILLLGADALKALFGTHAALNKYRGVVTDYLGAKLVVTNNPADVLRNPGNMPVFENDIELFSKLVKGTYKVSAPTKYVLVDDTNKLNEMYLALKPFKDFALDCEWRGERYTLPDAHLLTIQICCEEGSAYVIMLRSDVSDRNFNGNISDVVRVLSKLLERPGIRLAGHNLRADLKWLKSLGLNTVVDSFARYGFDTMLADHLLEENAQHALEACVVRNTTMGRYDLELKRMLDKGYIHATVPDEMLWQYAACDADAVFRLWRIYEQRLKELPDTYNLFTKIVMPVNAPINEMEMTGLLLDRQLLETMTEQFVAKSEEIFKEIKRITNDEDFNPRSVNQVREFLFGNSKFSVDGKTRLQLTPLKSTGKPSQQWAKLVDLGDVVWTEKGWVSEKYSPSTDAESLSVLSESVGEVRFLRDFKFIDQILKNFLRPPVCDEDDGEEYDGGLLGLCDSDGRIRTSISQMTETGRYRSYKPNLQNLQLEVVKPFELLEHLYYAAATA